MLTSVPGIGITTAATLMVEIDDITRFANAEHLAVFIGLIPMCHTSSETERIGGITVAGTSCFDACWLKLPGFPSVKIR